MPVTVTLSVSPTSGPSGTPVMLTYNVQGADDEPAVSLPGQHIDGSTVVDGVTYEADVDFTLTKPAVVHTKVYNPPASSAFTNVQPVSGQPHKFTATAV